MDEEMKPIEIKWTMTGLQHLLERGPIHSKGICLSLGMDGLEIHAIGAKGIAKTSLRIPTSAIDAIIDGLTAVQQAARANAGIARVRWEIDISTTNDDPNRDAEAAMECMRRPGSIATCFTVFNHLGEIHHVDLLEDQP